MHHTNILTIKLNGLNLDIEPKLITSPRGIEKSRVSRNNLQFSKNPAARLKLTC